MTAEMIAFLSSSASGIVAIIVCLINNKYQNGKTLALLDLRLKTIEDKMDKYNNVIERTYELEKTAEVHEEKIKTANHRIEDLERGVSK